jgi:hypothetical protein
LTSLSSLFGVNQGEKATQESIYNFSQQLTKTLAIKNRFYFEHLAIGRNDSDQDILNKKVNYILADKPYLIRHRLKVKDILEKATELGFASNGVIDAHRYFTDVNYRNNVANYYNLIKESINIFDVLNKLPHFYTMYDAFVSGEQYLLDNVNKYQVIQTTIPHVLSYDMDNLNEDSIKIDSAAINKEVRILNSKNMPFKFSDNLLSKINDWYDDVVILEFLKNQQIKLDVNQLMDYLGVSKINLMRDSKNAVESDTYQKGSDLGPNAIIDLSTEYGLAQFKYVMEQNIIPYLKLKNPDNGFLKEYIFGKYKNYNLRNQIS